MNIKLIGYWITTAIIAFVMLSGGITYLARVEATIEGLADLGYPLYFITLLGFWKVLGGVAILVPRLGRLKEWAYAGIFFDLSGAAVSNAAAGNYGVYAFHIIVPIVLVILAVASWALRPSGRTLGVLFPARN